MNSIHYPYLVEHNKYQELLCTSLERKGFKVVKVEKSIFKLLKYCIFSKIKILHFHWLHGITNSQGKVKTFFRIFGLTREIMQPMLKVSNEIIMFL